VQRYVSALKTTEDAAIKLYAPIMKVAALRAAVRADTKEMDSPVQVCHRNSLDINSLKWVKPKSEKVSPRKFISSILSEVGTRNSADADKPARRASRSVKVTKHGTIRYVRYSFLLVCFSNAPLSRYSTSQNVTLKSGSELTQGHRSRHRSVRHLWLPIKRYIATKGVSRTVSR